MQKHIIGVTEPSQFTDDCINAIEKYFNANPLKLCQNEVEDIEHWLSLCSGVILAGGVDIHPRLYGCSVLNDFGFERFDIARDFRETVIISYCLKHGIPILGICRGHQILGIYHGMSMIPDLSESMTCHSPIKQKIDHSKDKSMHFVQLALGIDQSFIPKKAKKDPILPHKKDQNTIWVNSFHHQGIFHEEDQVKQVADVEVLGVAKGNGEGKDTQQIVELMRGTSKPWLSCQWHPEYDWEVSSSSEMVLSQFKKMMNKK